MPIKKGGKSIVLDAKILSSVDLRRGEEGFRGSLTSYIETLLGQYVAGKLAQSMGSEGKDFSGIKMQLIEVYRWIMALENELPSGVIKSLRAGKGPLDLRGQTGSTPEQAPPVKANLRKG